MELNSLNSNDRGPSKEHPYEVLSKLAQWFRRKRFLKIFPKHKLQMVWVKGHANNTENERCDKLAVDAAKGDNLIPDLGFENPPSGPLFKND